MDVVALFKKLMALLDPADWYEGNCTHHAPTNDQPPASLFLRHLEGFQIVLLAIATGFTLTVLLLAFLHWYCIWTLVSDEKRQNKLYFLISLFPVSTLCCFIGMAAPRTSMVMTSLGVLYFLTCFFVLISLIRHLFGGRSSFSTTLAYEEKRINFESPPFCCCCFFLPSAKSNVRNLRRLEWLVLQAPVVRAIIVAFNVIAVAELREGAQRYIHLSEMVSVGSLLLAIFGLHTMARLTSDKLRHYSFMTIFRCVDIALLFFTAQQPMLFENILIRFGVFDCGPLLSAQDNARFICNFVIICEMFLLSIFATVFVSPPRSALFDLYRKSSSLQLHLTEETVLPLDDESV